MKTTKGYAGVFNDGSITGKLFSTKINCEVIYGMATPARTVRESDYAKLLKIAKWAARLDCEDFVQREHVAGGDCGKCQSCIARKMMGKGKR